MGGLTESHPIPLPSLYGKERSSVPCHVPHNDMVNSEFVVDIKPGDSCLVNGYQIDEFISLIMFISDVMY